MDEKKNVLVTGACGFIGRTLSANLSRKYNVIGIDSQQGSSGAGYHHIIADITDPLKIQDIFETYKPSVVVHCAGIAHQTFVKSGRETYLKVNSDATEHLAETASKWNPDVHFILLSSMSVYGELPFREPFKETDECNPSSNYAYSKLEAERRLKYLYRDSSLKKVDILRLAPVYDTNWSKNLEKRVFAPRKVVYLRIGTGTQSLSILSTLNLVEFINYRLQQKFAKSSFYNTFNVCDEKSYKFNDIIRVFEQSVHQPQRPLLKVPLGVVWSVTCIAGLIFKRNRKWIHSFYNKLAYSIVVDNRKMLKTGFKPKHSLESVFYE